MKQNVFKIVTLVCLLLSPFGWAHAEETLKDVVERKIHKEFSVSEAATVDINNRFGDVNIVTWDQNQVVIDVTISVRGSSQKKIDDQLERISISFDNSPNFVKVKTIIENNWGWTSWFSSMRQSDFQIDYKVKMPKSNTLHLSNDYGSIFLDEIDGNTKISCDYGKLILGELRGDSNTLSFDYTSNSSIDYIKKGVISADYSGFELGVAEQLELSADYTNSKIEKVTSLNFNTDYGKLTVTNAQEIEGQGDYITLRFGDIHQSLDVKTDYGSLRIDQLQPTVTSTRIESDYTGIRLGVAPNLPFQFTVDLDYAGFQTDLPLTYQKEIKDNSDKYFQGYHLEKNSPNTIQIKADYGNVKLLKANN